jgi:peptidoglycan/xylan/chitin deacetylase (PgdA/CDA1 family)
MFRRLCFWYSGNMAIIQEKRNLVLTWLLFALFVYCLGLGGFFFYRYYIGLQASDSAQSADNDEQASPTLGTADAKDKYAASIKPDYQIPAVTGGLAPIVSRIPTKEPVVFLGIDDGAYKDASVLQLMEHNNIRASLFLADRFVGQNTQIFAQLASAGSLVENHTLTHKLLPELGYDEQKAEICGQASLEEQEFGRRPILFRPPGGSFNTDTQRAAADCGMKAVVLWIAKANGGSMQYQIGKGLKAGDIVLMHFRPEFKDDMKAFVDAENAAGLHTELLENWLP